ncbi:ubiquitin carboxyl-terminal hydrolase 8-like isoform X1 [Adelges cooleyi]|uniref:ubiquitin carboxyl-terminal hydrolase 8-like isoform X1 n=1 Tax=Adelges cooleyi TaxID=133065 RepID=UPI00218086C0|nr:ubiquitin carboxyl-terminal hydrolase 8-like isoform X1 [Adelges cooleyi]
MRNKVDLSIASSIEDLTNKIQISKKFTKLNTTSLSDKAKLLFEEAMKYNEINDEERVYIYLMKYCELMTLIKNHKDYENDPKYFNLMYCSNLKKAVNLLKHVKSSLEKRYSEKAIADEQNDKISQIGQEINIKTIEKIKSESTISNKDLLYLLNNTDKKLILILDTRPPELFQQFQITECDVCDVINVPKDILCSGLTADTLKNKLLDKYKTKWINRHFYNYIVILDKGTEDIEDDPKLMDLKVALLKWDPTHDNSKKLKFLKGGFEDFCHLCPWKTTEKEIINSSNTEQYSDTKQESFSTYQEDGSTIVSYPSLEIVQSNLNQIHLNDSDDNKLKDNRNLTMQFIDSNNSEEIIEPYEPSEGLIEPPTFDRSTKIPYNIEQLENRQLSLNHNNMDNSESLLDELGYQNLENNPCIIPHVDRSTKPLDELQTISNSKIIGGDGLRGLQNLGNTCYMNSILQCLSSTEDLAKYFINHFDKFINHKSRTQGFVAKEFRNVIVNLWSQSSRSFQCQTFKNTIGQYKDMFKHYDQQDSHEFLTILLDWLHDDLNKPKNNTIILGASKETGEEDWGQWTNINNSIIQSLFYGQQKSSVSCDTCSEKSTTFEPFSSLSLPLPSEGNKCTLSDCLKLYLNGESISGWHCPKCKRSRDATKKLDIMRLPPYLIIHLKRFSSSGYKKNTYVEFPKTDLDMTDFINGTEHRNWKYYLYGVSNHSGSLDGGHYTAYCLKTSINKWYKFDDVRVYDISSSMVCSSESYILFYCRKSL